MTVEAKIQAWKSWVDSLILASPDLERQSYLVEERAKANVALNLLGGNNSGANVDFTLHPDVVELPILVSGALSSAGDALEIDVSGFAIGASAAFDIDVAGGDVELAIEGRVTAAMDFRSYDRNGPTFMVADGTKTSAALSYAVAQYRLHLVSVISGSPTVTVAGRAVRGGALI